jgi:DNA helicase-2/ATP-dependent DNA helicase PcrA
MKEELPEGDFHIQEERRLFYVALTRAMDRLTVTTVADKEGKMSTFIEDMLMDPAVKKKDIVQIAPKLPAQESGDVANERSAGIREASLFPASAAPPKIFSRVAAWGEVFHPPSPEPLKLSPSAVDSYRKCPQQYLFSRLWSLKEGPRAVLSFGSVMHTTIKRFVDQLRRGVKPPFEEVAGIFETEWTSAGFEDQYQESEYKKDGLEQLRVFHEATIAAPPQVLEQEKSFELPMENNVIVAGRIDQINSLGRKDVEIVDYKTGKPKKDADAKKDLQLSLYALAAKEIFEWNPVRLVFHYLQNNQAQVTTRDAKQLDEAQKIVQEAAADIRAGEFSAKPGFICRNCAFKPICPAHEEALNSPV